MYISGAAQDESSGQTTWAGRSEVGLWWGEVEFNDTEVGIQAGGYLCQATVELVSAENHHGFWRLIVSACTCGSPRSSLSDDMFRIKEVDKPCKCSHASSSCVPAWSCRLV